MHLLAVHSFDGSALWLDWGKLTGHMFGGLGRVRVDDGRHKALVEAVGRLMTGSRLTIPVVLTNWPARLGEGALKELVRAVPGVTALCLPFDEAQSLDKGTHSMDHPNDCRLYSPHLGA